MADNNRNQQSSYRNSNQDWNENRGRMGQEDENRNSGSNENRGMRSSNRDDDDGNSGWQSRYERQNYNRGDGYNSDRSGRSYDNDFSSGNYGSDRESGYASYYGSGTGSGYGSSSGSSSYDRDRNSENRGLYDRDYQGITRSGYYNSGTRLGGGNYGNYGDQNRGYYERRNEERNSGSNYGGNYGNRSGNPGVREDRNWWDRTSDEVSSWFGDEEAERRRDRDKKMSGQHKGKGPKNYSRSDERIKEDINDRLSDDPFIDASDIDVTVTNGEVTLTGTVDERSNKRRAEDLAENVSGVKNVENRIRVGSTASSTPGATTSSTTEGSSSSQSSSGVAGSERTRNKSYVTN